MLETLYQNLMINQEKEVNIKCEDLSNKKEFLSESEPTILTKSTPEIPQPSGSIGVEWSSLSKTQKKRMKAKVKDRDTIKEINESMDPKSDNTAKKYIEKDVKSMPKIRFDDPLIKSLENELDKHVGSN